MNKTILVINTDVKEMQAIQRNLSSPSTKVVCVSTIVEAMSLLAKMEFCLIILDAEISTEDNHKLLAAIRRSKTTPILILSSQSCYVERMRVLQAGAHAYIGKPYSLEECLAQAQALMHLYCGQREKSGICYTLAFGKELVIEPLMRRVLLNGKDLHLTPKEFDLLFCLASNPGQVFSREQLYDHVWNEDSIYNVDEVVKAHIKALRRKLSDSEITYIKNVWGIGYRFQPEPGDE